MLENKVTQALYDDGIMSALFKAGFIGAKAFLYRDIYLWVDVQMKARPISKNKAMFEATLKFNVSEDTIKRAIKSFK